MNINFFKVSAGFFAAGVILSAMFMVQLARYSDTIYIRPAFVVIAFTCLCAILSIYFAGDATPAIVYVAKKGPREETQSTTNNDPPSEIDFECLEKVRSDPDYTPQKFLNELCRQLEAGQGAVYVSRENILELLYGFALITTIDTNKLFGLKEGIIGGVAASGKSIYIDKLPEGHIKVFSGLGTSSPSHLIAVPIYRGEELIAVVEVATFKPARRETIQDLERLGKMIDLGFE